VLLALVSAVRLEPVLVPKLQEPVLEQDVELDEVQVLVVQVMCQFQQLTILQLRHHLSQCRQLKLELEQHHGHHDF
jgi:hypothetical protein